MWHLADYRASALDIATSNGFDVGSYDPLRTKKMLARWRAVLKAIRGDLAAAKELVFAQRGRPPGTRVIDNKLVYANDLVGPSDEGNGYSGKRRGRPVGSRLGPDGKLILPTQSSQGMKSAAREETESEVSADTDLEMLDQGPRPMTGLDGNTSFDQRDPATRVLDEIDDEEEVDELPLADLQDAPRPTSNKGKGKAPSHPAPLTKEQIISSVETGDFADDEAGLDRDSDKEREWWEGPLPPARGGTEESDGGDYDPRKESQEERAERRRREKSVSKARQEETSRKGKEKQKEKYVPPARYRPWVKDW
jgi:hypothetical protein